MPDLIWVKEMKCPVCAENFLSENIRNNRLRQTRVDEDFHTHFEEASPLYYHVVVCPACLYGERRNVFSDLRAKQAEQVRARAAALKSLAAGLDFNRLRDFRLALKSFEIGAAVAQFKEESSDVVGGMYLRAAWCCREQGEDALELDYLKKTLEYYEKAYLNENTEFGQLGTCGFQYMLGEIYRRLGNPRQAAVLYSKALSNKEIKDKPQVSRMARDQLNAVKAGLGA